MIKDDMIQKMLIVCVAILIHISGLPFIREILFIPAMYFTFCELCNTLLMMSIPKLSLSKSHDILDEIGNQRISRLGFWAFLYRMKLHFNELQTNTDGAYTAKLEKTNHPFVKNGNNKFDIIVDSFFTLLLIFSGLPVVAIMYTVCVAIQFSILDSTIIDVSSESSPAK